MGSAEAPARSFSPCRCLDAHSLASGTVFPIAEPALHEDSSTRVLSSPTWSFSFPCCSLPVQDHLPPLPPATVTPSWSLSSMFLCTDVPRDLASVCQGSAPLPSSCSRLAASPRASFPPARVALYVPFPRLFHPDLYQVTGIWVPHLSVVAQPLRLGVFPSMTSICPSVAIGNFCSVYSRTGASFVRNNR